MRKVYKAILWLIVVFYALIGLAVKTYVPEAVSFGCPPLSSLNFRSYNVTLLLWDDGSALVEEVWELELTDNVSALYRYFTYDGYDDIILVRAYEITDGSSASLVVEKHELAGVKGFRFQIPSAAGIRRFVFQYIVRNLAWGNEECSEISWAPFPAGIMAEIAEFRAIVGNRNASVEVEGAEAYIEISNKTLTTVVARFSGKLEEVRVRIFVTPGVFVQYSLRKVLSRKEYIEFLAFLINALILALVTASVAYSKRTEYILPSIVTRELDGVEFFLLVRKPEKKLLGTAALLQLVVEGSAEVSLTANGISVKPTKKKPQKTWLRAALQSATQGRFTSSTIGEAVMLYEDAVYSSLKAKGYSMRPRWENSEPDSSAITVFAFAFTWLCAIIHAIGSAYAYGILFTSTLAISVVSLGIARLKDFRTPKGRGAISSVRREISDLLAQLKISLDKEALSELFEEFLPYVLAFEDLLAEMLKLSDVVVEGWRPKYLRKREAVRTGDILRVVEELLKL